MSCGICYEDINDILIVKVCQNGHKCCRSCCLKIEKCHMCRSNIRICNSFSVFSCEDLFSKEEITDLFVDFISSWKISNFLRRNNDDVLSVLNEQQLNVLPSCKKNKKYKLYRGLSKVKYTDIYSDLYVSSWSTNEIVAKRFGKHILCIEIEPEYVFLDLEYLRDDFEKEVLVFPGNYPIIYDTNKIFSFSSLSLFTSTNRDIILNSRGKSDPLCWTIVEIKMLLEHLKIPYIKSGIKSYYVDKLIEYNNSIQ